MKPIEKSPSQAKTAYKLCSVIIMIQILTSCNANQNNRPNTEKAETVQAIKVDKEVMDGFDTAKWYYYYFNAVRDRNEILPLESYSVHPTLYNLDLLNYSKSSDTIRYFIRTSFVSTKFPCINMQDSIEIYMTVGRKHLFSLTTYDANMSCQTGFDLDDFRRDKILLKKIDSFLVMCGREVNPWFQKEARVKGFWNLN